MNSFILGFHLLVWCPKWTPASRSSFMVTVVDKPASLEESATGPWGPPAYRPAPRSRLEIESHRLALAELEPPAGTLLPVLLALLDAGVPGEEAGLLEALAQLQVEHAEGPGDPVPHRARLGIGAAAVHGGDHVELLHGLREDERLLEEHLQGLL